MELPRPPLQSITSVVTLYEECVSTVYSSSNYYIIPESIPGQLVIKTGPTPPYQTERAVGGYQVVYVAGYGDDGSYVPSAIKTAITLWATKMYEERAISTTPPPEAVASLNLYKIYRIGEYA